MSIEAGKAVVRIFGDKSPLVRELRGAQADLQKFGEGLKTLGAGFAAVGTAIVAPIVAASVQFAEVGDMLDEMSGRTGMSVEALSELKYAADLSGGSIEGMETSIRKMQRAIYDASTGSKSAAEALGAIGLTADDLKGKSPEEQFMILADRLAAIQDPSTQAAIAMELFGKTGTNLLPMLANGSAGLAAMRDEARRLGQTMSAEDAKAAAAYADTLDNLKKSLASIGVAIGSAVAPLLTELGNALVENVTKIRAWVMDNKQMVVTALKVGATLAAAGTALVAFGSVFTGLAGVIKTVIAVIGSLNVALSFLAAHPAVAVIAGLTAGAIALNYALNQASAVTWELTNAQKGLADAADKTRAGDLAQVDRLAALANQQSLTSAELDEAQGIVAALQDRYGNLGLSVDTTTGKILGMADAQQKLNGAMADQVKQEMADQLEEHTANLNRLQKAINEVEESGGIFGTTAGFRSEQYAQLSQEIDKEVAAIEAIGRRRRNLQKGDKAALTGEGGEQPAKPPTPDFTQQANLAKQREEAEKTAKYEESLAEKVHSAQIALIENKHDRELAQIREKWAKEREEAAKANASVEAMSEIDRAEELEVQKAKADQAREVGEANRQIAQDTAGARIDIEAQQIQTRINSLKARGSEDKNVARQIAGLELELDQKRLEQQLVNIEAERKAALDAAAESGMSVEALNEKYRAMADLAKASFQTSRTALASSIQYKGPAQALVVGSEESYNASIGIKQPMDELVAEARADAVRQEEALKTLKEIAGKQPKVLTSPA